MWRVMLLAAVALAMCTVHGGPVAAETTCTLESETCTSQDALPAGFGFMTKPQDGCTAKARVYDCREADTDQCTALRASSKCTRTGETCLALKNGECVHKQETFECLNEDNPMAPAVLIGTVYENLRERIDEACPPGVPGPACRSGSTTCTAGPETRMIRGFPVFRDCWEWEKTYECKGGEETSQCAAFQSDTTCKLVGTECLATAPDGTCSHTQYRYRCGVENPEPPTQCEALNICVGGVCETHPAEPNADFGLAASWLGVLDQMAKDKEFVPYSDDISVFKGKAGTCRKQALNVLNCCSDDGWGLGWLSYCRDAELELMDRKRAGATTYLGTYCSDRILGICVEKKRVYCAYNSKLARVFQEQVHKLDDRGYGRSLTDPECPGISIQQLEALDMDQIDLSEAFPDQWKDAEVPAADMVKDFLKNQLGNPAVENQP